MIVYVPKWMEFSYLFTIKNKQVFYGEYEPSLFDEDNVTFIIKECKDPAKYEQDKQIIVITNNDKYEKINPKQVIEKICEFFNYPYSSKILQYCEKKEYCPFMLIYRLSLGDEWPKEDRKPLIPMVNTISTVKFLQAAVWYYYLGKKYHKIFRDYALDKVIYLSTSFIEMEKDFGFVDEEISNVLLLPILKFY